MLDKQWEDEGVLWTEGPQVTTADCFPRSFSAPVIASIGNQRWGWLAHLCNTPITPAKYFHLSHLPTPRTTARIRTQPGLLSCQERKSDPWLRIVSLNCSQSL